MLYIIILYFFTLPAAIQRPDMSLCSFLFFAWLKWLFKTPPKIRSHTWGSNHLLTKHMEVQKGPFGPREIAVPAFPCKTAGLILGCIFFDSKKCGSSPNLANDGGNSKIFLFSLRKLGKMNPFWLSHIFQMGGKKPPTSYLDAQIFEKLQKW